MKLKRYKGIFLDGDGVLWKSDQPIPGINPFFDFLAEQEIKWALLTNNNTRTAQNYIDKLGKFGIPARSNTIYTSSTITTDYLLAQFGQGAHLYVVGMDGLFSTLKEAGFQITHGEKVSENEVVAVVAGMDRQINLQKIKVAMRLILGGAAFIATNTDGSFPTPEGLEPGTGMVIGALQFASGVEPFVAGKPHPAIFQAALKALGCAPGDVLMVGDRLETDILGASLLGIPSALVLTGITSREHISQSHIKPDFIFEDIAALHQALGEVFKKQ
ncbi:MAG: HAD-IIA family hydrolase [Anaerolineales bacterium]